MAEYKPAADEEGGKVKKVADLAMRLERETGQVMFVA
jgi:hypothetical protein